MAKSKKKALPKAVSTTRDRVDFINFIIDATNDTKLARDFLKCNTAVKIQNFFKKEGYRDVPLNDCEDILAASTLMRGKGVNSQGEPVDSSTLQKRRRSY